MNMILFYDDWKRYPSAIIHTSTSNKSFLRLAGLYKKMGVKNHAFLLALHDHSLEHIDPFDPTLTKDIMERIAIECKINPWYFFREVARVPPISGNNPVQLRANRGNIAIFWLFFNHITSYLIQVRQTGKSLSVNEIHSYINNIASSNNESSILTKDDKLRNRTSLSIRDIMSYLPAYLKMLSKSDVKNSERITIKLLNNIINLYVGRDSKKAADNLGRGMTTPIVQIDEFAYIPNIDITLPVLLAATGAAREEAAKNGSHYGTIFTTTPGKLYSESGKFAYEVYNNSFRWTEKLFDVENEKELNDFIEKNTVQSDKKYKIVLVEMYHKQLGYTDEWLMNKIRESMTSGENKESDYLLKWVGSNESSPIPKQYIKVINNSVRSDYNTKIYKHNFMIRWYLDNSELDILLKSSYLVIGLDTSEAIGSDNIGLVILNSKNGEVVGVGRYNEVNLTIFSDFIADLLLNIPNSVLIIEKRSTGLAIIDNLVNILISHNINPLTRIFNWVVDNNKDSKLVNKKILNINELDSVRKYFGFSTSGSGVTSRNEIYGNVFNHALRYTADKINDKDLETELLTLTIKNGRIDHASGGHDDLVIAWLLGYWFLLKAKNKNMYHIRGSTLGDIIDIEMKLSNKDINYIKRQQAIKNYIMELVKNLRSIQNELHAIRLLMRIKKLEKELDLSVVKSFNLDDILDNIKIAKRLKRKLKV